MNNENNSDELILNIKNADLMLGGKKILNNINWQLRRGEHWFILGVNGAGKTTLTKMIMGHVWPLFGAEVSVLGCRYGETDLFEIRKKIAWISPAFQNFANGSVKVLDLVVSALHGTVGLFRAAKKAELEKAMEVLGELGCEKLAELEFDKTSSGEQVKIMLARALMTSPAIIILDEACVHLDMKSREFLLETIDRLARKKHSPSFIFITHRIEEIGPVFSNGMILKDGTIIFKGKREEILTEENLFKAFEIKVKIQKCGRNRFWALPER